MKANLPLVLTVMVVLPGILGAPGLSSAAGPRDSRFGPIERAYHRAIGRDVKLRRPTGAELAAVKDATRGLRVDARRFAPGNARSPQVVTWLEGRVVHQQSRIVIDRPLASLTRIIDPKLWSTYLPLRPGGKVVRMQNGNVERMVLLPLDMSKYVTFDGNRIDWSVKGSRRSIWTLFHRTVRMDDGFIELVPQGDKTLIVARSKHDISTLPTAALARLGLQRTADRMHELGLKSFWGKALKRYQDYGEGRRPPRQPRRGEVVHE